MNTMMMALLQGRLWDAASSLQQRLRALDSATDEMGEAEIAGELSQVIHALDALRTGRYGYCGGCRQPVELDQLLTKPHRLRCISCESHEAHEAHADFAALAHRVPSSASGVSAVG
jgi:RNA polymerase-binding transcription factor DksA